MLYLEYALKAKPANDLFNSVYAMFFFFLLFSLESKCCGYPFELHRFVDAIQVVTNTICLNKEVDKKYTSLKTAKYFDRALMCDIYVEYGIFFCQK